MKIEVGQVWEHSEYGWLRIITIISGDYIWFTEILSTEMVTEFCGCYTKSFNDWINKVDAKLIRINEGKPDPLLQMYADYLIKKNDNESNRSS